MLQLISYDRFGHPLADLWGVKNVSRSFALNRSGTMTFDIGLSHPKCSVTYLEHGNILVAYSDTLEPWAGYISSLDWDLGADMLHVGCTSVLQRLGKSRMTPAKVVGFAHEHIKHIVNDANSPEHRGIYLGSLFTGGDEMTIEYSSDNNYDRLVELLAQAHMEMTLTMEEPNRHVLAVLPTIGTDKTTTVQIISGIDMDGGGSYREDSSESRNVITALGKPPEDAHPPEGGYTPEEDWNRKPKATYTNRDKPKTLNIDKFGWSEEVIEFSDVADVGTLAKMAREEGLKREIPQRPVTFNLNTKRGLWSRFTDGDIVALYMPKVRFTGLAVPFRITGREINEDSNVMTVTGDVVAGEAAQNLAMYKLAQYGSNVL